MDLNIAVIAGDGVGPEVVAEGVKTLRAIGQRFNHGFSFSRAAMGASAFDETGEALPDDTVETCRRSDAILFGAVGDPRYEQPNLSVRPEPGYGIIRLRRTLGLFANIRPVRLFSSLTDSTQLKPEVVRGVDFIIVRELTGGIYFGEPKRLIRSPQGRSAIDTLVYSEEEIRRILEVGFELARGRRKRLTSVDKFQILRSSDLWREIAHEVAREYPDVTVEHALVDSCAMRLIRNPTEFDVMVTENLFGDILSDEAAMLVGSLGMVPSASLREVPRKGNKVFGLYEPIHGSAPILAGLDKANPIAAILSAALLLRYSAALNKEAEVIEEAVDRVLEEGYRTEDIGSGGTTLVGTKEMGDQIAEKIIAL